MRSLPQPEDLESSPVWSVIRAAHALERHVTTLFGAYDLTPVQFGVLSYLSANGPMTTAALSRCVLVRPQSIAGVVDAMDRRGLVRRDGPRGRGRGNPVHLTRTGEDLLASVWPSFLDANTSTALGLSAQHATLLPRLMNDLLEHQTTHDHARPTVVAPPASHHRGQT